MAFPSKTNGKTKRTLNYIFLPNGKITTEPSTHSSRVKNVKTFVRWPVLIVAELLSFTVRRSLDARAVKNGFSFKN